MHPGMWGGSRKSKNLYGPGPPQGPLVTEPYKATTLEQEKKEGLPAWQIPLIEIPNVVGGGFTISIENPLLKGGGGGRMKLINSRGGR